MIFSCIVFQTGYKKEITQTKEQLELFVMISNLISNCAVAAQILINIIASTQSTHAIVKDAH